LLEKQELSEALADKLMPNSIHGFSGREAMKLHFGGFHSKTARSIEM